MPINLLTTKLSIFTNSLFTNNANLILQLSFTIILTNKAPFNKNKFIINNNIIYFSLIKNK